MRTTFQIGKLKPNTNVHIPHFGNAKFLRINEYKHAVIKVGKIEMSVSRRTLVKKIL